MSLVIVIYCIIGVHIVVVPIGIGIIHNIGIVGGGIIVIATTTAGIIIDRRGIIVRIIIRIVVVVGIVIIPLLSCIVSAIPLGSIFLVIVVVTAIYSLLTRCANVIIIVPSRVSLREGIGDLLGKAALTAVEGWTEGDLRSFILLLLLFSECRSNIIYMWKNTTK